MEVERVAADLTARIAYDVLRYSKSKSALRRGVFRRKPERDEKIEAADFIAFDLENKAKASTKRNAPAKRPGTFKPLASPNMDIMKTLK